MNVFRVSILQLILTVISLFGSVECYWPINSIRIPPWNIYDCIYRFYICTERIGTWSENKNICNIRFEQCHNYITGKNANLDISSEESEGTLTTPSNTTITSTATTTTTTPITPTTTPPPAENHFVIVGGNSKSDYLSSVETLDENQHLTCNIPSYPIAIEAHASTLTTSGILVCGGYSSGYRKDCYEFSSNSWTRIPPMTGERRYFGMIYLKEKVYAVAGHGSSGSENSMEIFDSTTRKWKKQSIPFSVQHHCITQLSANQFILIGGCKGRAGVCGRRDLATTWIFDVSTNNWSNGPRLSTKRRYPGCFSIKDNNMITQIVVMGGYDGSDYLSSTEILDVNSMTWRTGPALPISVSRNRGLQSEVGPYLGFSTGGYNGQSQNKIYGLKKTSKEIFEWEEVHSMTTARYLHSVVNTPKTLLPNC